MGLNIEHRSFEWGTYYDDIKNGNFDICIMKWTGVNDPDILRISLDSEMLPPGRNRGFYKNQKFDKLVRQAIREENPTKRKSLYFKAQDIIFADKPIIPLWHEKQVAIAHKRVKNYDLTTNGDFSSLIKVFKVDE